MNESFKKYLIIPYCRENENQFGKGINLGVEGANIHYNPHKLSRILRIFNTLLDEKSLDRNLYMIRNDGSVNSEANIAELLELTQVKREPVPGHEDFVELLYRSKIDPQLIFNYELRHKLREMYRYRKTDSKNINNNNNNHRNNSINNQSNLPANSSENIGQSAAYSEGPPSTSAAAIGVNSDQNHQNQSPTDNPDVQDANNHENIEESEQVHDGFNVLADENDEIIPTEQPVSSQQTNEIDPIVPNQQQTRTYPKQIDRISSENIQNETLRDNNETNHVYRSSKKRKYNFLNNDDNDDLNQPEISKKVDEKAILSDVQSQNWYSLSDEESSNKSPVQDKAESFSSEDNGLDSHKPTENSNILNVINDWEVIDPVGNRRDNSARSGRKRKLVLHSDDSQIFSAKKIKTNNKLMPKSAKRKYIKKAKPSVANSWTTLSPARITRSVKKRNITDDSDVPNKISK